MEFKLYKWGLGFFSDTFRLLQTYMVCKKNNIKLYVNSEGWSFKYNLGWNDWFTTLDVTDKEVPEINYDDPSDYQFTNLDYRNAIKELFVFQPYLYDLADKVANELELGDSYVSIFIRRGDKLLQENLYVSSEVYVDLALSKNPSVIFVQTDDYRAFEEIRDLVHAKNPSIRVLTKCSKEKCGFFFYPIGTIGIKSVQVNLEDGTSKILSSNSTYINSTPQQKFFQHYTREEVKSHVEEMIIGLIVCQRSNYLVLDNMSNTGRYLIFSHNRGKDGILLLEDFNLLISENIKFLVNIDYSDNKYTCNPRYYSLFNK
jgi:hypothetical protein